MGTFKQVVCFILVITINSSVSAENVKAAAANEGHKSITTPFTSDGITSTEAVPGISIGVKSGTTRFPSDGITSTEAVPGMSNVATSTRNAKPVTIIAKQEYGQPCNKTHQCQSQFICSIKCRCNEAFRYWNGTACLAKHEYGQPCNKAQQCQSQFICNTKCSCNKTIQYWNGSACLAKPTSPVCSTESRNYQSTNSTITLNVKFQNKINEATQYCVFTNQSDPRCEEPGQPSITVEGLNPGTLYEMAIFAATRSGSNVIYSQHGCNITVVTRPTDPSCTKTNADTDPLVTDSNFTFNFNVTNGVSGATFFCVKTYPNVTSNVCSKQNTSIDVKGLEPGKVYSMSVYTAIKTSDDNFVYSEHGCSNRTIVTRPSKPICHQISNDTLVANTSVTLETNIVDKGQLHSTVTYICVRTYPSTNKQDICIQREEEEITVQDLKKGTEYDISFYTAFKLNGEQFVYSKQGCSNITVFTRPSGPSCKDIQSVMAISASDSITLNSSSVHVDKKNITNICAIELNKKTTKCATNSQDTIAFKGLEAGMPYNFRIYTSQSFGNANKTLTSSQGCEIQIYTRPDLKCDTLTVDPYHPAIISISGESDRFLQLLIVLQPSGINGTNITLKKDESGTYDTKKYLLPGQNYNATVYAEGYGNLSTMDGCRIPLSRKVPKPSCDSSSWRIYSNVVYIRGSTCNFTGRFLKVNLYTDTRYFSSTNRTEEAQFLGLPPGRLLTAIITSVGENGQESSVLTVTVKTKPTTPSCSQVNLESTNETITVQPGSFSAQGALDFIIYKEETNKTLSHSGAPVVFSGLFPGKMYHFHVRSLSEEGATSVHGCNFTGYTKPNAPNCESVVISLSRKNALSLNVSGVYSEGAVSYRAEYVALNLSETVTFNSSVIQLTKSLQYGQNYTLVFYALGKESKSSERCLRTLYTYPAIPIYSTESKSAESFVIEWQLLKGNSDRFNVEANCSCSSSLCKICNPQITILGYSSANISNLLAGTHCNISVQAIYQSLPSAPLTHSVTTDERVPDIVKNLNYTSVTKNELTIQWEEPNCRNGDIYEYSLIIATEKTSQIATNTTTSNSFTFSSLNPGVCYTAQVAATNGAGTGAFSSLTVSTIESVPEAVTMLKSTNMSSTSIMVSWRKPLITNGVITKYELLVKENKTSTCVQRIVYECLNCSFPCIYPESVSFKKDIVDKSSCHMPPVETFSRNEDTFRYTVSNLDFFTQYDFEVVGYTSKGPGSVSVTSRKTSADLPPAPTNLMAKPIESNALELIFQIPENTNGDITNIMIEYSFNEHHCVSDESTKEAKTKKEILGKSEIIEKLHREVLKNLYTYWDYSIRVKLGTYAGYGNYSEEIDVRTLPSVPEKVGNISVSDISSRSVQVHWTKPCHPNGEIEFYFITIIDENGDKNGSQKIDSKSTSLLLETLLPFRVYQFNVSTKVTNVSDQSTPRTSDLIKTKTEAPLKPGIFQSTQVTATTVNLSWEPPSLQTGPTSYVVVAMDVNEGRNKTACTLIGFLNTSCVVSNLRPFWNYTLIVSATVESFDPKSRTLNVKTKESAPGQLSSFQISQEENIKAPRAIHLKWNPPSEYDKHGIIRKYYIQYWVLDRPQMIFNKSFMPSVLSTTVKNVLPYKTYKFQIFSRTIANASDRDYIHGNITIKAGAPLPINLTSAQKIISVGPSGQVSKEEYQLSIFLNIPFLCDNKNGNPESWYIIVADESTINQELLSPFHDTVAEYHKYIKRNYKSYARVHDQDHFDPYIATNTWKPSCKLVSGQLEITVTVAYVTFLVGQEGDCEDKSGYCNGYLKPKTKYKVRSTVCTNVGCLESEFSTALETKPNLLPAIIVPSVVVPSVLACIVLLVVMKRNKKGPFKDKRKTVESGSENDAFSTELEAKNISKPRPVKITEFAEHVQKMHADSNLIFSSEYKLLKEVSPTHTTKAAEIQVNRIKNRYTNILSYDHSRVKLLPTEDDEGSDYVNANYIQGYSSPREYIATQGPLPFTRDDFWRMIWEQNVSTIVMLTQLVERGRRKCDIYWPETTREPVYYGDLVVEIESESTLPDYVLRVMSVKLGDSRKTVKHFSYLAWPDMGIPETSESMLKFTKEVRSHLPPPTTNRGPLVVHCSAGVGRTGTFIAVDYLMQHVTTSDVIDIYGYVMKMRNNRPNMVQTEDQYIFIHDCISDFINKSDDDSEDEEGEQENPIYANA